MIKLSPEELKNFKAMSEEDQASFIKEKEDQIKSSLYTLIIYFQLAVETLDEIPKEIIADVKLKAKLRPAKNAMYTLLNKVYTRANLDKRALANFTELSGMVEEIVQISIGDAQKSIERLMKHGLKEE